MDKKEKVLELVKMKEAISKGEANFILLNKLNEVIDKVENIKPTDVTDIKEKLEEIEQQISEPVEVELLIED